MPLAFFVYHSFDPTALHIGFLQIRWYGLAYLFGFLISFSILKEMSRRGTLQLSSDLLSDLIGWLAAGVIFGGRIGWWLFYHRSEGAAEPWYEPLAVWHGGMSFHGGLIGVLLALSIWSRKKSVSFWNLVDYLSLVTPVGIFLGRIANFINAELVGRTTALPWGVIFPGDTVPRHPSQLYEAILEGPLLLACLWANRPIFKCAGAGRFTRDGTTRRCRRITSSWWLGPNCPGRSGRSANNRLAAIRSRLKENFSVSTCMMVGSFHRRTSIRGMSDADLFVVLRREEVKWGNGYKSSATVLDNLRTDLIARYPTTTIGRDGQAVVVAFTDFNIDVVPGFYHKPTGSGHPMFYMPDGKGNWMATSPHIDHRFLKAKSEESGGKLKRTAQLLKFWRDCRAPNVPLSSFYIEMALAVDEVCIGVKSYGSCLYRAFQCLSKRECRGFRDPNEVNGIVRGASSETKRELALNVVRYSRDQAKLALDAEAAGKNMDANYRWGP